MKKPLPPAPRKFAEPAPMAAPEPLRLPMAPQRQLPAGPPRTPFPRPTPEMRPMHDSPGELPPLPSPRSKGPPLFIKLEKYQDVVNTLHKMKTFSLSLRDALDALADVERELRNGIGVTHKALDAFNASIASLDAKISRLPPEVEMDPAQRAEIDELDDYVKGLHDQVEKIRNELKSAALP
ncbi:MAG: hypothetical protein HY369_05445 [Candidatus Aenigmarchaeota archaeon]|nr:hypothetical protein [Candidatus Aenigmarchaeota archaeon]